MRGVEYIADLRAFPEMPAFLQSAFIEESGAALIRKYNGLDPLFTKTRFRHYADDLLERMMNPYLKDTIQRVSRDPERKLGWQDRLIGTIRLALSQGLKPIRFTLGAAAALSALDATALRTPDAISARLSALWAGASPELSEKQEILTLIQEACGKLLVLTFSVVTPIIGCATWQIGEIYAHNKGNSVKNSLFLRQIQVKIDATTESVRTREFSVLREVKP